MAISQIKVNGTTHDVKAKSCSGNSATATKLATARKISLTGAVTGSGSFDGSGNLSITTTGGSSTTLYEHVYGMFNSMYEDTFTFSVIDSYATHGSNISTILSNLCSRHNGKKFLGGGGQSGYAGGNNIAYVQVSTSGIAPYFYSSPGTFATGGGVWQGDDSASLIFYSDRALS